MGMQIAITTLKNKVALLSEVNKVYMYICTCQYFDSYKTLREFLAYVHDEMKVYLE